MSKSFHRVVVAAILVAAATPAVLGAEGRIPIWAPVVIGPGAEGKYIVTRDVLAAAGTPVVTILPGTAAVDIDLNGFTLWGVGADVINATGVDSLTVRNGTLIGGTNGIWAQQCRKVVIEDVKIQVSGADGIALMDVISFAVRRNIVQDALASGITIDGTFVDPTTTTTGAVDDNALYRCGRGIQLFNGSSVGIKDNRIETTVVADGIFISPGAGGIIGCGSCLVADNTIQEAHTNGMWLSDFRGGKIHNNEVISAGFNLGGEGIWLDQGSNNNLVLDNVATECGRHGMFVVSNGNHLERNVLNGNGVTFPPAWGLYVVGSSNTYRGNTGQFNAGNTAACPGAPATTDICIGGPANNSPGDNFMPFAL